MEQYEVKTTAEEIISRVREVMFYRNKTLNIPFSPHQEKLLFVCDRDKNKSFLFPLQSNCFVSSARIYVDLFQHLEVQLHLES